MSETLQIIIQGGSLGALVLIIGGLGYLARIAIPSVASFFSGLLAEFRRSNDATFAITGKLDAGAERATREHGEIRAHIDARSAELARQIDTSREQLHDALRSRLSAVEDSVVEELHRTGQHPAVAVEDRPELAPPPRRPATNPKMPAAR